MADTEKSFGTRESDLVSGNESVLQFVALLYGKIAKLGFSAQIGDPRLSSREQNALIDGAIYADALTGQLVNKV